MANIKAIVTLCIGEPYLQTWTTLCRRNWQRYADKHGYDIVCVTRPLDVSARAAARSPAWQKCLVLSQDFSNKYERIVWLDSDILINHHTAPCAADGVPVEKVGAVDASSTPSADLVRLALERLYDFWADPEMYREYETREYYTRYNLFPAFDQMVRTGVLVLSPRHHRKLLEAAYDNQETRTDDMRFISHELLKADCVQWIDGRFDPVWLLLKALHYPFLLEKPTKQPRLIAAIKRKLFGSPDKDNRRELLKACVNTAFQNNYFLHFPGLLNEMSLVESA